ncbi:MAG: hypothetical protein J6T16_05555 [Opitutales bacterium]|nr:hypothetical protein [Opitutales bacterium]
MHCLLLILSAAELGLVVWLGLIMHDIFAKLRFWIELDAATLEFIENSAIAEKYGALLKFRAKKIKELSAKNGGIL